MPPSVWKYMTVLHACSKCEEKKIGFSLVIGVHDFEGGPQAIWGSEQSHGSHSPALRELDNELNYAYNEEAPSFIRLMLLPDSTPCTQSQ